MTKQFPELLNIEKSFRATCGLFDGEIVSLDAMGKPLFKKVITRLMSSSDSAIIKLSKTNPVYCYVFDCLYLDGRSLIHEPFLKRREWLKDAIRTDGAYRLSELMEDGEGLFQAAREHDLEGIIAKRKDGKYLPGKRSDYWMKVKVRNTTEVVIIGYTKGKGEREKTFGALHIAEQLPSGLQYRGKVGTGFDDATMKAIRKQLDEVAETKKPIKEKTLDDRVTTWLAPTLLAEVMYSKLTPDKMFREPVFVRLRLDLS